MRRQQGQWTAEPESGEIPSLDTVIEGPARPEPTGTRERLAPVPRRPTAVPRPDAAEEDFPTRVAGAGGPPSPRAALDEPPTVPGGQVRVSPAPVRSGAPARMIAEDPPTVPGKPGAQAAPVPEEEEEESTAVGPPPDVAAGPSDEVLRRIGIEIEAMMERSPTVMRSLPDAAAPEARRPERAVLPPPPEEPTPAVHPMVGSVLDPSAAIATALWSDEATPAVVMLPASVAAPPAEPFVLADAGSDPGARSLMTRLPAAPMPAPETPSAGPGPSQRAFPTERVDLPHGDDLAAAAVRFRTDPGLRAPGPRWMPLAIVGAVVLLSLVLFIVWRTQRNAADAVGVARQAAIDAQNLAKEAKKAARRSRPRAATTEQPAPPPPPVAAATVAAPPAAPLAGDPAVPGAVAASAGAAVTTPAPGAPLPPPALVTPLAPGPAPVAGAPLPPAAGPPPPLPVAAPPGGAAAPPAAAPAAAPVAPAVDAAPEPVAAPEPTPAKVPRRAARRPPRGQRAEPVARPPPRRRPAKREPPPRRPRPARPSGGSDGFHRFE